MSDETSAHVDFEFANNATWQDALQFGDEDDTSWTLDNVDFRMDIKANKEDVAALATYSTTDGTIQILDPVLRIIAMNVPDALIQADLPVGHYVYDLIMYDDSIPPQRVRLTRGHIRVVQGITGD